MEVGNGKEVKETPPFHKEVVPKFKRETVKTVNNRHVGVHSMNWRDPKTKENKLFTPPLPTELRNKLLTSFTTLSDRVSSVQIYKKE